MNLWLFLDACQHEFFYEVKDTITGPVLAMKSKVGNSNVHVSIIYAELLISNNDLQENIIRNAKIELP